MKAWLTDNFEGLQSLHQSEILDPIASRGEAVLVVQLAGLNPADRYLAMGQYPGKPPLPHVLGRDAIGVVESIGQGVTGVKPGDQVIVLRSDIGVSRAGTFAEKVAVPVESLTAVPAGWTAEQAGGAPLVYLTAYQALTQWGDLPSSVVLVTGASGGVGIAAVQLAAAAGHLVIALSRSDSKRKQLAAIGASHCFDPADNNWPSQLKLALGTRKVDVAVDNVGGAGFSQLISTLGHNGKISVVGRLAGPVPEFNTSSLFFRRIKIGGVAVGDYKPAESQVAWKNVVEMLGRTGSRPLIDSIFGFDQLPEAFAKLLDGPMGKVLLRTGS